MFAQWICELRGLLVICCNDGNKKSRISDQVINARHKITILMYSDHHKTTIDVNCGEKAHFNTYLRIVRGQSDEIYILGCVKVKLVFN